MDWVRESVAELRKSENIAAMANLRARIDKLLTQLQKRVHNSSSKFVNKSERQYLKQLINENRKGLKRRKVATEEGWLESRTQRVGTGQILSRS